MTAFWIIFLICAYFLPTIVAICKAANNGFDTIGGAAVIFVSNCVFGWTGVGWFVVLMASIFVGD
jgi:hypothetical protein